MGPSIGRTGWRFERRGARLAPPPWRATAGRTIVRYARSPLCRDRLGRDRLLRFRWGTRQPGAAQRSEERRVGKEYTTRKWLYHLKMVAKMIVRLPHRFWGYRRHFKYLDHVIGK